MRSRRPLLRRAIGLVYCVGLLGSALGLGGLACLWSEPGVPAGGMEDWGRAAAVTLAALAAAALAGRPFWRGGRRGALYTTILLGLCASVVLLGAEVLVRGFVPPRPARALHGVAPELGRETWGRVEEKGQGVGFNDSGQRDRPRGLRPASGVVRVAFVGDSLLEESAGVPLSVRVEQKIARTTVEVINLGVSATGLDEYYHRMRHVALPLGARCCVVFLYAGNDFLDPPHTLESLGGIAAVAPRGSLLTALGLGGLNHLLTNRRRPVLRTWLLAGDLHQEEERLRALLSVLDDENAARYLRKIMTSRLEPAQHERLARHLKENDLSAFYRMLREPDEGLFRSYYLMHALRAAAVPEAEMPPPSEESACHWVAHMQELCRDRCVRFLLVVVPEAFQVDGRMREQWAPLADMRRYTRATREVSLLLMERLRPLGVDILDLHGPLAEVPGTYLNLDGQWSTAGIERISDLVAQALRERLDAAPLDGSGD